MLLNLEADEQAEAAAAAAHEALLAGKQQPR
jgi:hypothetical protein